MRVPRLGVAIALGILICALAVESKDDSTAENFLKLRQKFERGRLRVPPSVAKSYGNVAANSEQKTKILEPSTREQCSAGYTGANCENPICYQRYTIAHHSGMGDYGETIDSEFSSECDDTFSFGVDEFLTTVFISITGLTDSNPSGVLYTPAGVEITASDTQRYSTSQVMYTYRDLAADYGYGTYQFTVSSYSRQSCMYTVQGETELVIDGGFIVDPRDDNVQETMPSAHQGIDRFPVIGTPSYFAFSMPSILHYPAQPTLFGVYAAGIYEQDFNVTARYQCNAMAIAGPYTCTRSEYYHAKIVGVDSNGNIWQRVYDFSCEASGTPAPTSPLPPPEYCLNGGILVNGGTSNATCYCGQYFEGHECETLRCFNDGTVGVDGRCQCLIGYSGTYCEDVVCTSQAGTNFNIDVRALTFVIRSTVSMALQRIEIVRAAERILGYYETIHARYFQKFVLVGVANGEIVYLNEFDTSTSFVSAISDIPVLEDEVCKDSILAALSSALDSPALAQYMYSPIFVFSDGLSNDDDTVQSTLHHQLSFWRGQVYFILTDSINGQCTIDMADPGYRNLRQLAQFSHGIVSHVDASELSQATFQIASILYHMNYLLANDFLHSCDGAPKYQTFFVDSSVSYVFILATGIELTATVTYPDRHVAEPEIYYHANNTYIWHITEAVERGSYLLSIQGHAKNPCQYRVLGRTDYDLFIGITESLTKDATITQPTWNTESHIVARVSNVPLPDTQSIHAEAIIWTNEGENDQRTVLYASNGFYRDKCDYHLYFGAWSCRTVDQYFYVNIFLTDSSGRTIMRTSTGFCSAVPPTSAPVGGCQNGGIPSGNDTCLCPAHYIGDHCENIQCLNLGTRIGSSCSCLAGFTGTYCETTTCYERNTDVSWDPHGRSLTFLIHDSISTRSTIRTIQENAARVLETASAQNQNWISRYQVIRFNDTDSEVMADSPNSDGCLKGIQSIYERNTRNSEISCADIALLPVLYNALIDPNVTEKGIFFIFINGYIANDVNYIAQIYEMLENSKVQLNVVLLSGSPCGQSMEDYRVATLMNLAQFSNGQFILAMPSNAGKILHVVPTIYRSSYIYENFVTDCSTNQSFYFPVDSQTQAFTAYIVGDLDVDPVYYSPIIEQTAELQGIWKVETPVNMWNDIGMGSRMDQIIQQCDDGWDMNDNLCWKYSLVRKTWYDAQADCHSEGAVLATIYNANEQAFIDSQVFGTDYWTGLSDLASENNWAWDQLTGSLPLSTTGYSNWAQGQPTQDIQKRCVYDSHSGSIGWVNTDCNSRYAYICMKHAYDSDFEPSIDGKTNILTRGIWKMELRTYEGPCYVQIFGQSGIELYTRYTTGVHEDSGYAEPMSVASTNRIIAHTTQQQWAGQGVEGELEYAHLYNTNLTIIQAQRFQRRDEHECAYEFISTEFKCPSLGFLMLATGIDRYGYLYQRIQQVMCLTGPTSQDDCINDSVYVDGQCVCPPHYQGIYCEEPICLNNGYLSASGRLCICMPGFQDAYCQTPICTRRGEMEMPSGNNRTFVLLIDGSQTQGMASVIANLKTVLTAVLNEAAQHPNWFIHYTGVVFRDSSVTGGLGVTSDIIESDYPNDFIDAITAEAQKPYVSSQRSRAVIEAIVKVCESELIKPRSEFFVVTSGDAEDYARETLAMDAAARRRGYVNFLIVGDEEAPGGKNITDPSVEAYYNIAEMTGGNYYQVPGSDTGLQEFWVSLIDTLFDTYYISKVSRRNCSSLTEYIQVGANTTDLVIDAFAQIQPTIQLFDADGIQIYPFKNTTTNTNHLIMVNTAGEPGLWTIQIDQGMPNGGYCTVSVRGQSTMEIYIAFSLSVGVDGGLHSDDSYLSPIVGDNANAIIATSNAGTLLSVQVYSADERTLLWASPLTYRKRCQWEYISAHLFTCPAASFVVAVNGEDFEGHPIRRMFHIHCSGNFEPVPTENVTTTTPPSTTSPPSTTPLPTCDPDVPKFDAVLVFDASSGMHVDEFRSIIDTMQEFPRHVTIAPEHTRFIVGVYADTTDYFTGNIFENITSPTAYRDALSAYEIFGYSGVTGNNIQSIFDSINHDAYNRPEAQRIIIFFSSMGWDRGNNGQGFADPTETARAYRRSGVNIMAIGYGPAANQTQLEDISNCVRMANTNEELAGILPWVMSTFCREDQAC